MRNMDDIFIKETQNDIEDKLYSIQTNILDQDYKKYNHNRNILIIKNDEIELD